MIEEKKSQNIERQESKLEREKKTKLNLNVRTIPIIMNNIDKWTIQFKLWNQSILNLSIHFRSKWLICKTFRLNLILDFCRFVSVSLAKFELDWSHTTWFDVIGPHQTWSSMATKRSDFLTMERTVSDFSLLLFRYWFIIFSRSFQVYNNSSRFFAVFCLLLVLESAEKAKKSVLLVRFVILVRNFFSKYWNNVYLNSYFVLTRDYLHCFKRASGSVNERISDMGQFIFKVKQKPKLLTFIFHLHRDIKIKIAFDLI